MSNRARAWQRYYAEEGFFKVQHYFDEQDLEDVRKAAVSFFDAWKAANREFYEQEAFNASLITGTQYLSDEERLCLFQFISSEKMRCVIDSVIPGKAAFMNTQLFFNPVKPQQKDFWHRDCQYDHDIDDQKKAIQETQVVHLRIPLFDERGMELVPGTHKRWDNDEEFNVRQEEQGRCSSDDLSTGKSIPLASGDLLVFSADMIHRGLYGLDRLALDILVFDSAGDFADYVDDDCLPSETLLARIEAPGLFNNSLALKV